MKDEQIVAVPTEHLRQARLRQGFDTDVETIVVAALESGKARILPRRLAEVDPRFKQLICYVILRHGERVFHYLRSAQVGEGRLAGLRSVGLGGHLSVADAGADLDSVGREWLERAIQRELSEEAAVAEPPVVTYVGIINDDSTEVGRVHVGIVAQAHLAAPHVMLRDSSLSDGRFDTPESLRSQLDQFETWSQLCLRALLTRAESS
ncbi:MAG: phosphoesterase [Chloroflexi bacterium]|nr:phosphoesterase [Chloroflexota bacterium]